ncbi:MAG TPA: DUF364 domain-containing protein [Spirochaetota bacterium]|nr:DUF364 domain-containing protein [Spirochaetota bacterium]
MKILTDIISSLEKGIGIKEICRGPLWTGVVSRRCGLASALHEGDCSTAAGKGMLDPGAFLNMTADDMAELSFSEKIPEASLGLAAINSLIKLNEDDFEEVNASEFILKAGKGKNVSIIGHFPFVDEIREEARNLWVIEKRPREGDCTEDEGNKLLPESDVIAISSTTLINHTLSSILELCPPSSVKILLGPTTPMTEIFFDHGIDIISGSYVTDIPLVLESIGMGIGFSAMKKRGGIRLLSLVKDREMYKKIMG